MSNLSGHELSNAENGTLNGVAQLYPEDIAQLVGERVDEFWAAKPGPSSYKLRNYSEEELRIEDEEDKAEFIDREVAFVDKVYAAVTEIAASHDGPITLLLDIDETFVRNERNSGQSKSYIRPALKTLLDVLDKSPAAGRYDVGILTSRAQSHLNDELEFAEFGYLRDIGDRLNTEFVLSSWQDSPILAREELRRAPREADSAKLAVNAIRNIVRPDLASLAEAEDRLGILDIIEDGNWYNAKLAILDHLSVRHPDRGFVFVDDLSFPATVDPNHDRVRGVALGSARFSM